MVRRVPPTRLAQNRDRSRLENIREAASVLPPNLSRENMELTSALREINKWMSYSCLSNDFIPVPKFSKS